MKAKDILLVAVTGVLFTACKKETNSKTSVNDFSLQLNTGIWSADNITVGEIANLDAIEFTASKGNENIHFLISKSFTAGNSYKIYYYTGGFGNANELLPGIFTDKTIAINGKTLGAWAKASLRITSFDKSAKVVKADFESGGNILFLDNTIASIQGGQIEIHY